MEKSDGVEHAQRVSKILEGLYSNRPLTLAGLYHSTETGQNGVSSVDAEANEIVKGLSTLRKNIRSVEVAKLSRCLVDWKLSPAVLALFVVERYDHFDPYARFLNVPYLWRRDSIVPNIELLRSIKVEAHSVINREVAHPDEEIARLAIYAEMADIVGLTNYRMSFEMLHYLCGPQFHPASVDERFEEIEAFFKILTSSASLALIAQYCHQLHAVGFEAHWKWSTLDVILSTTSRKIEKEKERKKQNLKGTVLDENPSKSSKTQDIPIWTFGTITVDLGSTDECFDCVAVLCKHFNHSPQIESQLTQDSGSKAEIKLTLFLPSKDESGRDKVKPVCVAVRHRPDNIDSYYQRCQSIMGGQELRKNTIVYTCDGDQCILSDDAKLIDFAFSIHIDLVAHFEYALINNKRETNLMTPLRSGDRVEIITGEKFTWLSREWLVGLSAHARSALRNAYRPLLVSQALQLFATSYLKVKDFSTFTEQDRNELMSEIDQAGEKYLISQMSQGEFKKLRDRAKQGSPVFARHILMQLAFHHGDELNVPCIAAPKLLPHHFSAISAMVCENQFHDPTGGIAIENTSRFKPLYFVIVGEDRSGLVFEILHVFHRIGATIIEVAARTVYPQLAHFRITTLSMTKAQIQSIKTQLHSICKRVHSIDANSLPVQDEAPLPARPTSQAVTLVDELPTHRPIWEKHFFYGREEELKKITSEIQRVALFSTMKGSVVFINGALKVGKSSLAHQVLSYARTDIDLETPKLIVDVIAGSYDTFESVEQKILASVANQWGKFCNACGMISVPPPTTLDGLQTIMAKFTREIMPPVSDNGELRNIRPMIIILIDEFMTLLRDSHNRKEELDRKLTYLRDTCETMPGCLLMLVGPSLPTRLMPVRLLNPLQKCLQIPLGGLNFNAIRSMIRQEKIGHRRQKIISVSDEFIEKIYDETNGNPYWVANLINLALVSIRSGRRTTLEGEMVVALADDLVCRHPEIFSSSFMNFSGGTLHREILLFKKLCELKLERGCELQFNSRELADFGDIEFTKATLVLDCLKDTGGLLKKSDGFCVSAPILLRWLRSDFLQNL